MASVIYAVGNNWGSGFTGTVTVPGGTQGLTGWTVEFDAGFDITNIWGAQIVSHVGSHYVISSVDWDANVAAGGQTSFGFQANTGSGGTAASNFALNGSASNPPPPPALPTLSIADAAISEGAAAGQLSFTVTLSLASATPVSVHFATANGTATAGSDYGAVSGTLTFAAGETSKTITVPVMGETTAKPDETFSVALSAASGATIAHGTATGTIHDTLVPPAGTASINYAITSNWGSGFNGAMTVSAGSSALNGWTVEFDSTAAIGSIWNAVIVSHVGTHYVVSNAPYNAQVAAGQSVSFGFQATPGSGGTAASHFLVNGQAAGGNPPPPTLPTLGVADASVVEANSNTTDLAFTVSLSAAATSPVTVAYATANGTAIAGSNYAAASGTLTFAPGQTSEVVHVAVSANAAYGPNETLTLALSSPSGATIGHG
ncbi:MAG: cellulose binding domain-containing protein, partial [Alphaproteobacteria bacterium]|nr:cellulose binding domain-containing protein [Alphaproteobacteria bacterium]